MKLYIKYNRQLKLDVYLELIKMDADYKEHQPFMFDFDILKKS